MKIDVENMAKIIKMAEEQDIILEEEKLVQFILMFQKIVNIIKSSGEECELKLGDYKLSAKYKNYNSKNLTINVKKNRK